MPPTTIGAVTRISTNRGGSQEVRTISEEEGERLFFNQTVSLEMTMRSSSKRKRRKTQREATHKKRQGDPVFEEEESEIVFRNTESPTGRTSPVPRSPLVSPGGSTDLQYEDVLDMDILQPTVKRQPGSRPGDWRPDRTSSEKFGSSGDTVSSTGEYSTASHYPAGPH